MMDAAKSRWGRYAASAGATLQMAIMAVGMLIGVAALSVPDAQASLGYELDASTPSIGLQGELPSGVAIDQSNQRVYVAMPAKNLNNKEAGQIEQLESNGTPTAASPFVTTSQPFYSGVAVNPMTHGIYAAEFIASSPLVIGISRVDQFSSSGTLGTQFATSNGPGVVPKIGADSAGNLFYPNANSDAIQVFNSAGTLQQTISCTGCPAGGFSTPVGVALDSQNNLYVVDIGGDRVIKFTHSGGPYVYASQIQSGRGAVAVAVDPSDDSVFVGDLTSGKYHIVAYDSAGVQFDDFGAGLFEGSSFGASSAGQIAANETTHKLYVSDPDANALRVFARVTINPPTAATNAASSIGQLTAKMNGTVNAKLHATVDCHFEYVDDANFQATVYANAGKKTCSSMPDGSENTAVSATPTDLLPSTTYHFRVVAANNAGSVNGSNLTFTTLPATPPTVTATPPSGITQTGATLTGKVNPHGGSVTNCHFEYGPGLSYATSTPCKTTVGPVTTDVAESLNVTGLSPKTTYHYRLSVTSNAGTVVGGAEEFTTLPPAPTVTTDPASAITQTGATIAGTINPNGGVSDCHFEYGATTSYGGTAPCATDPGAGEGAVAEQLELTGLTAGVTYHYRLVGANGGGTTKGLDLSFTTLPAPAPVPLPEPPPPIAPIGEGTPPPKPPLKCKKGFQKKKVRGKLKCVKKRRHRRH
jgi:hypothetical protein